MSGVKVPRLGSSADKIFRSFLLRRASKEVFLNKILAQLAINTADKNKDVINSISVAWNDYVNMSFYLDSTKEEKSKEMMEEYEFWKTVQPKVKLGDNGKLVVTGVPTKF